jgi:predicted enzyme related to lactoylglutathione lyase
MSTNPVRWFEIYVQDMNRAKKFYEAVLSCKLEKLDSPYDIWAFPAQKDGFGSPGALVRMESVPSGGNSTIVYFASEDCATEEARVTKSGGEIHKGKFSIGQYGFISLVVDTEGNMFGLHSLK